MKNLFSKETKIVTFKQQIVTVVSSFAFIFLTVFFLYFFLFIYFSLVLCDVETLNLKDCHEVASYP